MARPVVTLFEHQFLSYQALGLAPQDPFYEAVERLNVSAGATILHLERTGLRATDRVGVVQVGDIPFEILPKIDDQPGVAQGRRGAAARNLLVMLSYAYDLPLQLEHEAGLGQYSGAWLDLLTHLFAHHLQQQFLSGTAYSYVEREDRLPVLRGRWDLARQSRRLPHERHQFDVNFEDFTTDSPLNQVFRFVVEALYGISPDNAARALFAGLRSRLQQVTLLPRISESLIEQVQFNRQNERFRPAFNLARLFLEGNVLQLRAGNLAAYAFVFEMDRLFERFTAAFLDRYRSKILPDRWQPFVTVTAQGAGLRTYLAASEGQKVLRLIPDLILRRKGNTQPLLIADTKYKWLEGEGVVSSEDAYQLLAYLVRFNCPRGLLLYPQPPGAPPIRRRLVIESGIAPGMQIFAGTINLHQPLDRPGPRIAELKEILNSML